MAVVQIRAPPAGFVNNEPWRSEYTTILAAEFDRTFNERTVIIQNGLAGTVQDTTYKVLFEGEEGVPIYFPTRKATLDRIRGSPNLDGKIYISQSTHIKLHKRGLLTLVGGDVDYPNLENVGGRAATKYICSPEDIPDEHTALFSHIRLPSLLKRNGTVKMNTFISLFYPLPAFRTLYDEYTYNPDNGVVVDTAESAQADESVIAPEQNEITQFPLSYNTRLAIAFMAALASTKTMMNAQQWRNITEKRTEALAFFMCDETPVLNIIRGFLTLAVCKAVHKSLSYRPKLKNTICSALLEAGSPLYAHASLIFRESNMTTFTLIYDFVFGHIKTQAHLDAGVMTQLREWLRVFFQLQSEYGLFWPFYKLFEPNGDMIYSRKWQRLTKIAVAYAIYHRGGTFSRMVNAKVIDKRTLELVGNIIKPEYLVDRQEEILDQQTYNAILTVMAINAELVPRVPAQRPDEMYEDLVDDNMIQRILAEVQNNANQPDEVEEVAGAGNQP